MSQEREGERPSPSPSPVRLPLRPPDMVRDVRDDDAGAEKESSLQDERCLVVEQMLPPTRGNELGQHDQKGIVGILLANHVEVSEQWADQRSVRRLDDDE